jgi:hypothetical protein
LSDSLEQVLAERVFIALLRRRAQVDDRTCEPLGGGFAEPEAGAAADALSTSLARQQLVADGARGGDPALDFPPSLVACRVSVTDFVGAGLGR